MTDFISNMQHAETQRTIARTGRRVEGAIHTGMLSLATAQAQAMKNLGTRIDDRLVEVNDTLKSQGEQMNAVIFGMTRMNQNILHGFNAIDIRLGDIEERLIKIEENTTNPERTRAFERFRRAMEIYEKEDMDRALDAVDFAINNDGGLAFDEIPDFQILKGQIHLRLSRSTDQERQDDFESAYQCFTLAATYLEAHNSDRGSAYLSAGLAAEYAGMLKESFTSYALAAKYLDNLQAHFAAAKAALNINDVDAAETHFTRCFQIDWDVLLAAASDPVCIEHAKITEPILRKLAEGEVARLKRNFSAIIYTLCGGARDDLSVARNNLTTAGNNLYKYLGVYTEPKRDLSQEDKDKIRELLTSDSGLIDLRRGFRDLNSKVDPLGNNMVEQAFARIHKSWTDTEEGLEEIQLCAKMGRINFRVGLPDAQVQKVPDVIPSRGFRRAFGFKTAQQLYRQKEIKKIEAENAKMAPIVQKNKEIMRDIILPEVKESMKAATHILLLQKDARATFRDIVNDKNVNKRAKVLYGDAI